MLPADRPRYVMGIGYPLDIILCSAMGADMYDSVYPTRTARFGAALVPEGVLRIKNQEFANDLRPLDPSCECFVCKTYTRAFLHPLVHRGVGFATTLISYHNIAYTQRLTREIRSAIESGTYADYVRKAVNLHFPDGDVPEWVTLACRLSEIELDVS